MNTTITENRPAQTSAHLGEGDAGLLEVPTPFGHDNDLPIVTLPGKSVSVTDCATKLFKIMAPARKIFSRGGAVFYLATNDDGVGILKMLGAQEARSVFDKYASLFVWRKGQKGLDVLQPTICSNDIACALLGSAEAKELLPRIIGVTNCPVIYENQGELHVAGHGYDEISKRYVFKGETPPWLELPEACGKLTALLDDYDFKTDADKSRAIASMISPALKFGGFIRGRIPADVGEADDSQSGKTYRQMIIAALYNDEVKLVAKREGGVGSVDESFCEILVQGRQFIQFDNFRGKLSSTFLEAFMTAKGSFDCRTPHRGSIEVCPDEFIIFMTSNGVDTTRDFANRSSMISIRKKPPGFQYKKYPEGELIHHVKANQAYYLGAVFSVIRAWHAAGKPTTDETRHDFREWCQITDWIVRNIFKMAPIMDGHRDMQQRVSNPNMVFLRAISMAYGKVTEFLGEKQSATDVAEVCESNDIKIPGSGHTQDIDILARRVGTCLGGLFRETAFVDIEEYRVTRSSEVVERKNADGSPNGTKIKNFYVFEKIGLVGSR